MSNLIIGYLNRADSATLTASPAAASNAPITYLQNDSRGHVFAAAAVGAQEIKATWGGTAYTIGCVHLDRTNLADGDTWRIQYYSDAAWTTQVYDSGTVAPFATGQYTDWDYSNAEMLTTVTASVKSVKVSVTSAAIFHAARIFIGPYTTAAYNPKMGAVVTWDSNSAQARMSGGTLSVNAQAQWRSLAFDMSATTEAERAVWMEIGRYSSNVKSVWVSVFPGLGGTVERDLSIMGKFEQSPATKWSGYNQFDFSLKLNEV